MKHVCHQNCVLICVRDPSDIHNTSKVKCKNRMFHLSLYCIEAFNKYTILWFNFSIMCYNLPISFHLTSTDSIECDGECLRLQYLFRLQTRSPCTCVWYMSRMQVCDQNTYTNRWLSWQICTFRPTSKLYVNIYFYKCFYKRYN